ncbi:MAG: hypothetical protein LBD30_04615, partial [Verrucomicrobiales bacterium]|nr:hypothetical protein [Verrucomicrobiales bacterium]
VKNSLLTDGMASLKKQLAEQTGQASAQVADLKAELGAAHQQLAEAAAKLAQKPPLPVTVSFRGRLLYKGYAARFSTIIKKDIQIVVLVKSSSSGETKSYKMNLGSPFSELSVSVFSGDELTLKHTEYADRTVICP